MNEASNFIIALIRKYQIKVFEFFYTSKSIILQGSQKLLFINFI